MHNRQYVIRIILFDRAVMESKTDHKSGQGIVVLLQRPCHFTLRLSVVTKSKTILSNYHQLKDLPQLRKNQFFKNNNSTIMVSTKGSMPGAVLLSYSTCSTPSTSLFAQMSYGITSTTIFPVLSLVSSSLQQQATAASPSSLHHGRQLVEQRSILIILQEAMRIVDNRQEEGDEENSLVLLLQLRAAPDPACDSSNNKNENRPSSNHQESRRQ
jgi:hypothetical protein